MPIDDSLCSLYARRMGGVEPGLKADRMPSMARELPGLIFLILAMGRAGAGGLVDGLCGVSAGMGRASAYRCFLMLCLWLRCSVEWSEWFRCMPVVTCFKRVFAGWLPIRRAKEPRI